MEHRCRSGSQLWGTGEARHVLTRDNPTAWRPGMLQPLELWGSGGERHSPPSDNLTAAGHDSDVVGAVGSAAVGLLCHHCSAAVVALRQSAVAPGLVGAAGAGRPSCRYAAVAGRLKGGKRWGGKEQGAAGTLRSKLRGGQGAGAAAGGGWEAGA
jgi:hypothetical protein